MRLLGANAGVVALAVALLASGACNGMTAPSIGSETNWIGGCTRDDECASGPCVCGICTDRCDESTPCPGDATTQICARASSKAFGTTCAAAKQRPAGVCLRPCGTDRDCDGAYQCEAGVCVPVSAARATEVAGSSTSLTENVAHFIPGADGALAACMPLSHANASDEKLTCSVLAWTFDGCDCTAAGLAPADPNVIESARNLLRARGQCDGDGAPSCASLCPCSVLEATGSALTDCEHQVFGPDVVGYCSVTGDAAIPKSCMLEHSSVQLRVPGISTGFVTFQCTATSRVEATSTTPAPIGRSCVPGDESAADFPGYGMMEVNVVTGAAGCETGLCLVNHFQGRTGCPYGQPADPNDRSAADPSLPWCKTPAGEPVTVPVTPQIADRRPEDAVYCSCRCDGPAGTGPFCACPSGFECALLMPDVRHTNQPLSGSYCIKAGTEVNDPTALLARAPLCRPATALCGPVP